MMYGCIERQSQQEKELIFNEGTEHIFANNMQITNLITELGSYRGIIKSKYKPLLDHCQTNNNLFEDIQFPPNQSSLGFQKSKRPIIWKRIHEIIQNAVMIEQKIEPADVQQGNIGDCYFLASISSLAENPHNIRNIFGKMQINKYGIYKLVVNHKGKPKELVIDDYIPVYENNPTRTVFCKPKNNEVWVILLQKAWAKLCGSYQNTVSGYPHQVLNTFTVSPCFYYDIKYNLNQTQKDYIWQILMESEKLNLTVCAGSHKKYICKGIFPAHTYSLLNCYQLEVKNQIYRLIKLRNPWGQKQYCGKCSEVDHKFWQNVESQLKDNIFKLQNVNDGVFTLLLEQFLRNFETLDICHTRNKFNYDHQIVHAKNKIPVYITLRVQQACQCYITVQKCNRLTDSSIKKIDFGYCKLMIAKNTLDSDSQLKYIASKQENLFPDVSIKCDLLQPGQYLIYALNYSPNSLEEDLTFSVYTPSVINLQLHQSITDKNFLQNVFKSYIKQFNTKKDYFNPDQLDNRNGWITSDILYENGGFAFMGIYISPTCQQGLLKFSKKQVLNYGYDYIGLQQNIQLTILAGETRIFIFHINPMKQIKKTEMTFPPKCIEFSLTI